MKRLIAAGLLLLFILMLPNSDDTWSYIDTLRDASTTLRAQSQRSDLAQDLYGFQAMVLNKDPYAVLGPVHKAMGIDWDVSYSSTHPPTAFLLTAPLAFLPWKIASALWAWLMLILFIVSMHAFGFEWPTAILVAVAAIYWLPAALIFGQLTSVWLLGVMLAYQYRHKHPFWAGVCISLASFTKFFPGLLLIPFIMRRKWKAVFGFAAVWLVVLVGLMVLTPTTIARYLEINKVNSYQMILHPDNMAFIPFLYRILGPGGMVLTSLFLLALVLSTVYLWFHRNAQDEISTAEWNLFSYLAVVLLPISWFFSIFPLFPVLLSTLRQKSMGRYFAAAALVLSVIAPPFSLKTPYYLYIFYLLTGLAIVLNRYPFLPPEAGLSNEAIPDMGKEEQVISI